MRAVIQRVLNADVVIDNKVYNKINQGLLIYLGFKETDTYELLDKFIAKLLKLRIFEDENGKTNLSLSDLKDPEILLISQFTLYGDLMSGNRPSFINAMEFDKATKMYEKAVEIFNKTIKTKPGIFGADMKVSSTNDGPFTVILEME